MGSEVDENAFTSCQGSRTIMLPIWNRTRALWVGIRYIGGHYVERCKRS